MTDPKRPERDISRTFEDLRAAVREYATPPAAANVRDRAEHQQRVRRTVNGFAVGAAVLAIAVGGVTILRDTAQHVPQQTADSTKPTPPWPTASPSPTLPPSPLPNPEASIGAVDDPITKVKWNGATITIARHDDCPAGTLRLRAAPSGGQPSGVFAPAGWPRIYLDSRRPRYGDVTGDGRPEAVMRATCLQDEQDSGDGEGQLIVIARTSGKLTALGWVGPQGGLYADFWIESDGIYADVHPWHTPFEYGIGMARSYRWESSQFVERPGYLPMQAMAGGTGPEIDFGPVADRSGCPAAAVRFDPDGRASGGGTTWDLAQPHAPDDLLHIFNLDGTGRRWVLAAVTCGEGEAGTTFLAVLRRQGGQFRVVDALRPPADRTLSGWTYENRTLLLESVDEAGATRADGYRWDGARFVR